MYKKLPLLLLMLFLFLQYSCTHYDETLDVEDYTELTDAYEGEYNVFLLEERLAEFTYSDFTCVITAPDDSIITRDGVFAHIDDEPTLTFDKGLAEGTYRLLALRYKLETKSTDTEEDLYDEYGLGCLINISSESGVTILSSYDSTLGFEGEGTETSPYIIGCYDDLDTLRDLVNDEDGNKFITNSTYFKQTADIEMFWASYYADDVSGWIPIGMETTNPFKGNYDGDFRKLTNIWASRLNQAGVALFGYISGASIKNVVMDNPQMEGAAFVGTIAGGVISPGDERKSSLVRACSTVNGHVLGTDGSIGMGGLIGAVDMGSSIVIDSCFNTSTSITGAYGVGGLVGTGALGSSIMVSCSQNSTDLTSTNTGIGGIVGTADSLFITACRNKGKIVGATNSTNSDSESSFAVGGIAGGAGMGQIYSSINEGDVSGYIGVGGIVGSTRVSGDDELVLNSIMIKYSYNGGDISGESAVGGIAGEAQLGGYALFNQGAIKASGTTDSHVGGICGNSSIAVVYNAVNSGAVTSSCTSGGAVGGIVAKSNWGSFLTCQNYGDVSGQADHVAGVVALAGNYTILNYCSNVGCISSTRTDNCIAGIVGELGDQREWSAANYAACVFGVFDVLAGVLGATFAVLEEGLELVTEKTTKLVLHIVETSVGGVGLLGDTGLLAYGVYEMLTEEEIQLMSTSISAASTDNAAMIRDTMNNFRTSYSIPKSLLQTDIDTGALLNFSNNAIAVNNFSEQDDESNSIINDNFNIKREERLEVIEERNKNQETIQKALSGVCILIATAASIASWVATGGAALAATVTCVAASVVGGSNAIYEGATDFKDNVAIISQCANHGKIDSQNDHGSSGIVALAHDKCWIKDCINTGSYSGDGSCKANSIIGTEEHQVVVDRCLIMGDSWDDGFPAGSDNSLMYEPSDSTKSDDKYAYNLADLSSISKYTNLGWDITSTSDKERAKWVLDPTEGMIPAPYYSEMQDEIEE